MGMTNTVRELKKSMDDMMNVCKKKLGEEVFENDMFYDAETVELMRNMFKMCDLATDLMVQQAETIERMDSKLDKLLAKS